MLWQAGWRQQGAGRLRLMEKEAGRPAFIDFRPAHAEDLPVTCADLSKANRLLGYSPHVSIEEGVREYVRWARDRAPFE